MHHENAAPLTVGIRQAARELRVAPSTISRQVAKGLILNRGSQIAPRVALDEARLALDQAAPSGFGLGEDHYAHKLDEADVQAARRLNAQGVPYRDIGLSFGVDPATAWRAVRRKNWRHVA